MQSYADYEWFLSRDLSRYSGKWLAIIDKNIVSSGVNAEDVIKEVREKYPTKKPLITKITDKLTVL